MSHFEIQTRFSLETDQFNLTLKEMFCFPSVQIISVTFLNFKLESSDSCSHDFVQIHDGSFSGARMIGKFCGTSLPLGGVVNSTHNTMYIWFKSDASTTADGFELTWFAAAPSKIHSLVYLHFTIGFVR